MAVMLKIDHRDFMALDVHGIMCRQHRDAIVCGVCAEHVPHQLPAFVIERGQGFIQDPEPGSGDEQTRQRQAAALPG